MLHTLMDDVNYLERNCVRKRKESIKHRLISKWLKIMFELMMYLSKPESFTNTGLHSSYASYSYLQDIITALRFK